MSNPRDRGSDFDAETLTVAGLVARAEELDALIYHAVLRAEGKFLAGIFIVREEKLVPKLKAAGANL